MQKIIDNAMIKDIHAYIEQSVEHVLDSSERHAADVMHAKLKVMRGSAAKRKPVVALQPLQALLDDDGGWPVA